jgi:hypothetical protein
MAGCYDNPICRTGPPGYIGGEIDSSESIPGLHKRLQIRVQAQATLDIGIFSLESIPGLFKRLQIRAQATLSSGIGSFWNRFLG